jgi:hypothetical protein
MSCEQSRLLRGDRLSSIYCNQLLMKVLIIAIDRERTGLARLPKALKEAGFEVGILCFSNSFLAKTIHVDKSFFFTNGKSWFKLLASLLEAMDWQPEFLIPGDEIAINFLLYVVELAKSHPELAPTPVLALINLSLGKPERLKSILLKDVAQGIVNKLGMRVPNDQVADTIEEALQFADTHGYPVVLKKDFAWNGMGVKICHQESELLQAWGKFRIKQPNRIKEYLRSLLKRDWYPKTQHLSIQEHISGQPAMYCLVAWAGEVVTGFAAIAERTHPGSTGPSSVVRFINHPEMAATASALIAHASFTGFAGLDFMISTADNQAYFLECNPRPIPIAHLGSIINNDLCIALHHKLHGQTLILPPDLIDNQTVAFFPNEWRRDPKSPWLTEAYHDVPWDDIPLFEALANK